MGKLLICGCFLLTLLSTTLFGSDLSVAIDSGRIEQVIYLLEQNPGSINTKNENGLTPLNQAAYLGNVELVKPLLEMGADPAIGDNENSRPIHNSAVGGHNDVIGLLLANGDDINARDDNGMTALLFSISFRKFETADFLLDKGADINIPNNYGSTPVHYAALRGAPDLVRRLASLGADLDVQSSEGETALHYTIWRNELDAARALLEAGAEIDIKEDYGRTPLHHAARETGNLEMARILVEHGADINALDRFDDTPLVLAAWRGFRGIVDLLLDHNADVPTTGSRGEQLLKYSTEKGLPRLFVILKDKNADLKIPNDNGGSLLHSAAMGGSNEIVDQFLQQGFDVNERDVFNWTPLHYAAWRGRTSVVDLLLTKGADINSRTSAGLSAYNLAESKNREETLKLLIDHRVDQSPQDFPDLSGPYMGQVPPSDEPQLFAPDIVSTNRGQHSAVVFSPDGQEAFWSSNFFPDDSGYSKGAMLCSRIENGNWIIPEFPGFTEGMVTNDDVAFFAPDGKKLYFISRRPLRPGERGGKENIWFVDRTESGWGEPLPVPGEVNAMQTHWQFSVTNTGTIYYTGGDPDGYGMGDIYRAELVNGSYAKPVNLGPIINTTLDETCPYIAPDESYLLFGSMGHQSQNGKTMIYTCYRKPDGGWSEPINTGIDGLCPIITADGKYLFFNGSHNDLHGIFWMKSDLIEKLKPANL